MLFGLFIQNEVFLSNHSELFHDPRAYPATWPDPSGFHFWIVPDPWVFHSPKNEIWRQKWSQSIAFNKNDGNKARGYQKTLKPHPQAFTYSRSNTCGISLKNYDRGSGLHAKIVPDPRGGEVNQKVEQCIMRWITIPLGLVRKVVLKHTSN